MIAKAYEILMDAELRELYDQGRSMDDLLKARQRKQEVYIAFCSCLQAYTTLERQ